MLRPSHSKELTSLEPVTGPTSFCVTVTKCLSQTTEGSKEGIFRPMVPEVSVQHVQRVWEETSSHHASQETWKVPPTSRVDLHPIPTHPSTLPPHSSTPPPLPHIPPPSPHTPTHTKLITLETASQTHPRGLFTNLLDLSLINVTEKNSTFHTRSESYPEPHPHLAVCV